MRFRRKTFRRSPMRRTFRRGRRSGRKVYGRSYKLSRGGIRF